MKLKLEKQTLVSLSSEEMNNVIGGGKARSDRRTGNCSFSRKTGVTWHWEDVDNDGCYEQVADGCYPDCATFAMEDGGAHSGMEAGTATDV